MIALACPAQKPSRCAAEPKSLTQEIHRETNSLGLWRKVESVQGPLLLVEGSHVCAVRCCGDVRSRMKAASRQVVNHPPPSKRKSLPVRVGFFVCLGAWERGSKPRDAGRLQEFGEDVSPPQTHGRPGGTTPGDSRRCRRAEGLAARASCAAGIRRPYLSFCFPYKVFLR